MSTNIEIANPLIPGAVDTPLDARSRAATLADVENIALPYVGMVFYVVATQKWYRVKTLKAKTIGAATVPNAAIDAYEEVPSGDMKKSVYDADNDGVVDTAKTAQGIGGKTAAEVAAAVDAIGDLAPATAEADGLMSAEDKARLDGLESGSGGDMTQAVYDTDGDGVVDQAETALNIGGKTAAEVAAAVDAIGDLAPATAEADGLMSAADKTKLDGIDIVSDFNVTELDSDNKAAVASTGIVGVVDDSGVQWAITDEMISYANGTATVDFSGILARKGISAISGTWRLIVSGGSGSSGGGGSSDVTLEQVRQEAAKAAIIFG